jgi:hypothetical protein
MDKYYLNTVNISSKNHFILRINPSFNLTIDEEIDKPYIELEIKKYDISKIEKPKNQTYETYKELDKTIYQGYFNGVIKAIKNLKWEGAEHYLRPQTQYGWTDLMLFTTDSKNKFSIHIEIRDSIDSLEIRIDTQNSFLYRQGCRKNGKSIPEGSFVAILKETLKFFLDENSYLINTAEFGSKIQKILISEVQPEPEHDLNVTNLIQQLETKKTDIISRLIENDDDGELSRASMRGEKEGIEYSLRVIKKFFRLINNTET